VEVKWDHKIQKFLQIYYLEPRVWIPRCLSVDRISLLRKYLKRGPQIVRSRQTKCWKIVECFSSLDCFCPSINLVSKVEKSLQDSTREYISVDQLFDRVFTDSCIRDVDFFKESRWLYDGLKGGPEPLEKEIHEILGSKREDRFSDPFCDWVQNTSLIRFS